MKIKRIKGVKYRIRMNRIVPTPFALFTIILTNPLLVNQKMKKSLTSICTGLLSKKMHKWRCLNKANLYKRKTVQKIGHM